MLMWSLNARSRPVHNIQFQSSVSFVRVVDKGRWRFSPNTPVKLSLRPLRPMGAPADCLPVEIWRDILLFAVESDIGPSVFSTTCTASTFIHFMNQRKRSYNGYMRRRATLRLVCHAWNQFLLSINSWWIRVDAPVRSRLTDNLSYFPDQSPTVKRLSMTITDRECVLSSLSWASNLQRAQVTPIIYDVTLPQCHLPIDICQERHELRGFLPEVRSNMALRSLWVVSQFRMPCQSCQVISFSQLNSNFKNLVSLSLCNLLMLSTEELTLPHLELLHLARSWAELPLPTRGWNLPRLRHVYLDGFLSTVYIETFLSFLRRYASQIETLFLIMSSPLYDLPHDFWDSFTALQLLGLQCDAMNYRGWTGWTVTPPRTHPFRYLVGMECWHGDVVAMGESLRSMWTYHEEVGLVIENSRHGGYSLIEGIKEEGWKTRMTKSDGILPNRRRSLD